ncbi:uncharacterized protein [Clytia hemisphaerica]|uniref:uncharacterized protein n=1 Tax=Clytia hemisphaerica TaxID=252671 RepID=UPI0034D49FEA
MGYNPCKNSPSKDLRAPHRSGIFLGLRHKSKLIVVLDPDLIEQELADYQLETGDSFVSYKKPKGFAGAITLEKKRIRFKEVENAESENLIPVDGTPFIINSAKEDHYVGKTINLVQDSRKFDCPAKVIIKDVTFFPENKIVNYQVENQRKKVSKKLKEEWEKNQWKDVRTERKFFIQIPNQKVHTHGKTLGLSQPVDPKIIEKIYQLAEKGIRRTKEIQGHLETFLEKELFRDKQMPSKDNRRYYPKKTDIRSYVYRAAMKLRFSKVDQEELDHRVKEWKKEQPEDSFFYRRYGGEDIPVYNEKGEKVDSLPKGKRLLFVHQTKRQRRLLAKYGNFVCLLDATYKTTKYSLPLFFIATRTNVDYQVVGSFVIQDETTVSIKEALAIVKSWNEKWSPKVFLVDNCEEEIQALEALFDSIVLFSSGAGMGTLVEDREEWNERCERIYLGYATGYRKVRNGERN